MNEELLVEILLVEDNKTHAELALRALEESNLSNHVVWLKNGKDALDLVFSEGQYTGLNITNYPKVILLDINNLAGGLEVLKKIRADQKTRNIPVAILASSEEKQDIFKSYNLGVNSYVIKPEDSEQFIESIKNISYYWTSINQAPK